MNILLLADVNTAGEWAAQENFIKEFKKKYKNINFLLITPFPLSFSLFNKKLFKQIYYLKIKNHKKPFRQYKKLLIFIYEGYRLIKKIKKNNKIDKVIISHYLFFLSYILAFKNKNYIFLFHGIKNNYLIFKDTWNHYLIFLKILENLSWILARKIIIPAKQSFFTIKKHVFLPLLIKNKKFIKINNLIDEIYFYKQKTIIRKNIILYCGRLAIKKGVENLIQAFLAISEKFKKWRLVICYPRTNSVDERYILKKYKNLDKVIFKANLNVNLLKTYYKKAKFAILPSFLENSSLFLKESIASNLPIFSTKTGDAEYLLTKEFLLKNNKIKTLSNAIYQFIAKKTFYQKKFVKISLNFKKRYQEEKRKSLKKFFNLIYEK